MKFEEYLVESEITDLEKELKGTPDYLKAPNGKKTNLTPRQWLTVRTKAFKKWFGDWENDKKNASKVLDENGEPLVVYHGTSVKFDRFEPNHSGNVGHDFGELIFFTDDHRVASGYSINMKKNKEIMNAIDKRDKLWNDVSKAVIDHGVQSDEFKTAHKKWKEADDLRSKHYDAIINYELITDGSNVIAGFLNIKNPYIVNGNGLNWRKVHTDAFEHYHDHNKYDGVIVTNVNDSATTNASYESTIYAFPKANQVKSAIGNKGTFNKDSDNLHESIIRENLMLKFTNILNEISMDETGIKKPSSASNRMIAMLSKRLDKSKHGELFENYKFIEENDTLFMIKDNEVVLIVAFENSGKYKTIANIIKHTTAERGVGLIAYEYIIHHYKYLISDKQQTSGARKVWIKLLNKHKNNAGVFDGQTFTKKTPDLDWVEDVYNSPVERLMIKK